MKLNLACGKNILEGWENHDREVDLLKPLPWANGSADFILLEHAIEHFPMSPAVAMLREFHRVLKHGGIARVGFPDPEKLAALSDDEQVQYAKSMKKIGVPIFTRDSYIILALIGWGHQTAWTVGLMTTVMRAIGFEPRVSTYGESIVPELCCVEGHYKLVGVSAMLETSVVEGIKI